MVIDRVVPDCDPLHPITRDIYLSDTECETMAASYQTKPS